jgi:hypothetical protein
VITTNSLGKRIAKTDEQIAAFWRWFGDSKAVDRQGRPLVLYHGSPHTFTSFRLKRDGRAVFLSPSPAFAREYAEDFADDAGAGIHIYRLYARVLNPFDYADEKMRKAALAALVEWGTAEPGGQLNDGMTMREVARGSFSAIEGEVMLPYIREYHDGFYVKESGARNLAVFSPLAIKAVDNRGTFDPSDPVITNPRRPRTGIHIRDTKSRFTDLILTGQKTIETRDTPRSLTPYVGRRVGLIRTGRGKAVLVGYATLGKPVHYRSLRQFRADAKRHRVLPGSTFDWRAEKWGFPLKRVERIRPRLVAAGGNRVARRINPRTIRP